MDFFHDYIMTWWQAGILKLGLWAIGLAIGATWPNFFRPLRPVLWVVFAICAGYLMYTFWPQMMNNHITP